MASVQASNMTSFLVAGVALYIAYYACVQLATYFRHRNFKQAHGAVAAFKVPQWVWFGQPADPKVVYTDPDLM
jgi:hypothetical protein